MRSVDTGEVLLREDLIAILTPLAVIERFQASLAYLTAGRIKGTLIGDGMGA